VPWSWSRWNFIHIAAVVLSQLLSRDATDAHEDVPADHRPGVVDCVTFHELNAAHWASVYLQSPEEAHCCSDPWHADRVFLCVQVDREEERRAHLVTLALLACVGVVGIGNGDQPDGDGLRPAGFLEVSGRNSSIDLRESL